MSTSLPCGTIGYMSNPRRFYINFNHGTYDVRDRERDHKVVAGSANYGEAVVLRDRLERA